MNIRFSRLNILILMIFFGPLLGCGAKNHAPFHVYRSALQGCDTISLQKMVPNKAEADTSDVRIAGIGFGNQ